MGFEISEELSLTLSEWEEKRAEAVKEIICILHEKKLTFRAANDVLHKALSELDRASQSNMV